MSSKISNRTVSLAAVAVLLGAMAPSTFAARTFCCSDEKGQQRCGDILPEACRSRAYVEYNEAGLRVRSVARPLTEAEQAVKDAEDKKQREQIEAIAQQQRSDQALLSTYADEKDLDTAVGRAVGELERSIKSAEAKLVELKNAKTKLAGEKEFYKNKSLPPDLAQKMARADTNIASQQAAIDEKKKDLDDTKAKFEGFRKRLQELKAKSKEDSKP
jgi:hypothetical protein